MLHPKYPSQVWPFTQRMRTAPACSLFLAALALLSPAMVAAQVAPDATATGPDSVTETEYKLPAAVDADILSGRATELWARVYRPSALPANPAPLVIFLHGNHGTCGRGTSPRVDDRVDYTNSGKCPSGYVVTPNHAGYGYLANKLASWGYVVVSINANRGITSGSGVTGDSGLNLARGRLILKHLQKLSEWNQSGGTPSSVGVELKGHLDFSNVALVGHSRGGEGVRAAYNQYRDSGSAWVARIVSPVSFKAIFEIGPVDGQTSRVLNADGTNWAVLLPMCDGDVSNLQGIRPFDRMMRIATENPPRQKVALAVWGANHNFYNTEWQTSDSSGCVGHTALFPKTVGSPKQQDTASYTVLALLRANLGDTADAAYGKIYNSRFALPPALAGITPIDRSFSDSAASSVSLTLDDFDKATGTSTAGAANESAGVTVAHGKAGNRHEAGQRAAAIAWSSGGPGVYFQSNFAAAGLGRDVTAYSYLNLRVARQDSAQNPATPLATNFTLVLVDAMGNKSSAVPLSAHMTLTGPVGGPAGKHVLLQSAQVPLASFGAVDLTKLRGVRLVFDDTVKGAIYVANLRFSNSQIPALLARLSDREEHSAATVATDEAYERSSTRERSAPRSPQPEVRDVAYLSGVQRIADPERLGAGAGADAFEIVVRTRDIFPARDELPILRIGERVCDLSRYPDSGEMNTLLFRFSGAEFSALPDGAEATLSYGAADAGARFHLGRLNKALVNSSVSSPN